MATVAEREARDVVAARYGLQYVVPRRPQLRGQDQGRPGGARGDPADVVRARSRIRSSTSCQPEQLRLYRLIWQRALASQMAAKELETTTVELTADRTTCARAPRGRPSTASPRSTPRAPTTAAEEAEAHAARRWPRASARPSSTSRPSQHFTQPPPRYTEATLIKALEERGIGRPSTYAATISTIIDRGYVTVVERRLRPEHVGEVVTDLLVEHFGEFVDYDFTARMEDDLDEVAEGKREWVPLLREFYDPFVELVDTQERAS